MNTTMTLLVALPPLWSFPGRGSNPFSLLAYGSVLNFFEKATYNMPIPATTSTPKPKG